MVLRDALMSVVWMAVNLLLARTSWRLAAALSPHGSFVDWLVDALVIGLSTIIAGAILLGTIGWLSGITLLVLVAMLAGAGEWLTRRILEQQPDSGPPDDSRADTRLTPLSEAPLPARSPTRWWGIVWGVLLAWLVSHMIVDGLLKFPTDWDCLMYHIPMVDEWLQARSLYAPDSSYWWSPGNSEVIGLWCVAPFSGDFLIALNNLPVMVLWVASTISVARSLGMSNAGSHFTALAVVLVHTSFHETDDASNDLLLVAAFTAAVAYLLRNLRQPRTTEVVLGGLSLGLLAGVKYFSVGYVTLVVGAWGIAALLNGLPGKRDTRRPNDDESGEDHMAPEPGPVVQPTASAALPGKFWSIGCELALLVALAIPCGAYWYVRNVLVSGSPFYPMGLGESPAVGYPNVGTTSLWGNPDPERWGLVLPSLWKMTGPIHLVAVLAVPVVICGLCGAPFWLSRKTRESTFERWRWPLLAALMAGCGVLILITPFAVEDQPGTLNHLQWAYTPVRYGLPFLSLSVVGLAVYLQSIVPSEDAPRRSPSWVAKGESLRWLGHFATAVSAALIAWQIVLRFEYAAIELDVTDSLLLAFNLSLVVMNWQLFSRQLAIGWLGAPAIATPLALMFLCGSVPFLSQRWHAGFDGHYDRFFHTTMFAELRRDYADADRICVLDLRHYAFFGSARERHVCRPRHLASIDELYAYLSDHNITYVVGQNGRPRAIDLYREVPRWLRLTPERFQARITGGVHTLFIYIPSGFVRGGRPNLPGDALSRQELDFAQHSVTRPDFVHCRGA